MRFPHLLSVATLAIAPVANALSLADFGAFNIIDVSALRAPHERANDNGADLHAASLGRRQADRCGASFSGQSCGAGLCCSQYGYCGTGEQFCRAIVGCQEQYGECGENIGEAPPPAPSTTSTSAAPVVTSTTSSAPVVSTPTSTSVVTSVLTSTLTSTSTSTLTSTVEPPSSSTSGLPPTATLVLSTNGMCGNTTTCSGSTYGDCCSQFFYCGSGPEYCGTGCFSEWGTCEGEVETPPTESSSTTTAAAEPTVATSAAPVPTTSTSAEVVVPTTSAAPPAPTPTIPVSTDGKCGAGITCQGSTFGECCSQFGYCGTDGNFCAVIAGCQPEFGRCDP